MADRKVAIMQPYWFPYIGYFQLLFQSDIFILYNDVQYIERGWINRNKFLINREAKMITLPLIKASASKKINEIYVDLDSPQIGKVIKSIQYNYSKAPYFEPVFEVFKNSLNKLDSRIDIVCYHSILSIMDYLGCDTEVVFSSNLNYNRNGSSVEKINELSKIFKADTIYFPSGSSLLYKDENFPNMDTFTINPNLSTYSQNQREFVSGLSILDLLMFNSKEECSRFILNDFKLDKLNAFN